MSVSLQNWSIAFGLCHLVCSDYCRLSSQMLTLILVRFFQFSKYPNRCLLAFKTRQCLGLQCGKLQMSVTVIQMSVTVVFKKRRASVCFKSLNLFLFYLNLACPWTQKMFFASWKFPCARAFHVLL